MGQAMARRPTITDLARISGVSVATVDRVLNNRLPVREETARRVYEAATDIGYHAAGLIKQRMRHELPEYRLGFLLLRREDVFYSEFARELELAVSQSQRFRGVATIDFASSLAPDEIVERMRKLAAKSRAIALVGPDHPTLTVAVEALKAKGLPVFSLLSDFASGVREGYVGLDNRKVGRTAAWMISKAARGRARSPSSSAVTDSMAMNCARSAFAPSSARTPPNSPCWRRWSIWKPTGSRMTRLSTSWRATRTLSAATSPAAAWKARSLA